MQAWLGRMRTRAPTGGLPNGIGSSAPTKPCSCERATTAMSLGGRVDDRAEADLRLEFLGADVAWRAPARRHRPAPGCGADVADHRGQHGEREIARAARADEFLVEVVEHIDAWSHLGDAAEVTRMHRRRRRATDTIGRECRRRVADPRHRRSSGVPLRPPRQCRPACSRDRNGRRGS